MKNFCKAISRNFGVDRVLNQVDLYRIITEKYNNSFQSDNSSIFRATGIIRLNEYRLSMQVHPSSHRQPNRISTKDEMVNMLQKCRKETAENIIKTSIVFKSGFIEGTFDVAVTSYKAVISARKYGKMRRNEKKAKLKF